MNNKILCIDDDASLLTGIQRNLRKQFEIETAVGSLAALKILESGTPYAVIVADMQMPGLNGVELLKIAKEKYPETVRIMLTGNADQKTAQEAVNKGQIFQFLCKPCSPDKLAESLTEALKQYRTNTAERELLESTLNGSVKILTQALAHSEPALFGRCQAVRELALQTAQVLWWDTPVSSIWELELAAMLFPIGAVNLPAELKQKVLKGIELTEAEQEAWAQATKAGSEQFVNIPRMELVARVLSYQNKNFDGTGFPRDAVKGTDIPLESRILRVVVDLVNLEARQMSREQALEQIHQPSGAYDPKILDAVGLVVSAANR